MSLVLDCFFFVLKKNFIRQTKNNSEKKAFSVVANIFILRYISEFLIFFYDKSELIALVHSAQVQFCASAKLRGCKVALLQTCAAAKLRCCKLALLQTCAVAIDLFFSSFFKSELS